MPMPVVTLQQRRARLATRHRLAVAQHIDSVPAVADAVVALHATDPATVYLSATARMRSPSIDAVAAALHTERTLVRHHGMRRTVWVCTPEVARLVHAACTVGIARREWQQFRTALAGSGIADAGIADPDDWIRTATADTLAAVHRLGPVTARALGKAVPELAIKVTMGGGKFAVQQSAHTRLLLNLGFDGRIVRTTPRGAWNTSEFAWSLTDDWIPGGLAGMDTPAARAELIGRYIRQFGPVTTDDVRWWAQLAAAPVRAAIRDIGAIEVQLDDGTPAWLMPDDLAPVELPEPWVALLPSLDPTSMGWKARQWYLGDLTTFGGPLFDRNGNVGPTIWADGEVVGGWAQRPDGAVVVSFLRPVDRRTAEKVTAAADLLRELIGPVRVAPRFPTPLQRELAQG